MTIAFFCDTYLPTHNGVAVSVSTTAREMRARGHRVIIFAPRYQGFEDDDLDVVRFPATPLFRVRDFPVAWPMLPYFSVLAWSRFLSEKFDVVHSHSPFILGTVGVRWAKYSGLPTVFTFHTLYHRYLHYSPFPEVMSRPYTLEKVRRYCRLCDQIVAPSHAIERVVNRFSPDSKVAIIPTGIDTEKMQSGERKAGREAFGIAADERVLLYVGRLANEKNLEFLIRSLATLLTGSGAQSTRLMLVGDGMAKESLQLAAKELQVEDRVIFTGFVDGQKLLDCYAAADIFVFASRTETQGVCIAEALAAGLPCVVVGAMGAAECVEDNVEGFVVPPRDQRFAQAVQKLLDDPALLQRMSEAAQKKSATLSLASRVSTLLETYSNLIESHAASSE